MVESRERRSYVLVNRDGVLNATIPGGCVTRIEELDVLPGAAWAVADLERHGIGVLVVSNQECVAKGLLAPADLDAITESLRARIAYVGGGRILDFFYCLHAADAGCPCRKPNPGLLFEARDRYGLDLRHTCLVGDAYSDLETARRAGCPAVFVRSGLDAVRFDSGEPPPVAPAFVAYDLAAATPFLIHWTERHTEQGQSM